MLTRVDFVKSNFHARLIKIDKNYFFIKIFLYIKHLIKLCLMLY